MGSRPEQFAEAANGLVEAGYDLIDINFGCPVKKVLGRCRGGVLLSEPENALAIVKAVIETVGGRRPVTVKMRRGFDDSAESERNFFSILDGAFSSLDIVGCEHSGAPLSGNRPTAILKTGSCRSESQSSASS